MIFGREEDGGGERGRPCKRIGTEGENGTALGRGGANVVKDEGAVRTDGGEDRRLGRGKAEGGYGFIGRWVCNVRYGCCST